MADNIKKLLADDSVSLQDAAQRIAASCISAIEKNEDDSKIEDELDALWSGILTAAEQTPHDRQDKLVQIVQAIKELSPASEKAKKISVWGEEKRWDELPMFGGKAREQLDIGMYRPSTLYINAMLKHQQPKKSPMRRV